MDYSKYTVLIVDDELEILKALKRGLHSEAYKTIFASSGKQALESFAEEETISVVLTDMRMPGMNGLELLKEIHAISPNTVKIVLTGYTQLPQILATINTVDIFKFVTKPWDLDAELKVYIKEAIEHYAAVVDESSRLMTHEKKSTLFNKMIVDSYEKVDYLLRLYDELMKALNQHHLFTIQALKGVEKTDQLPLVIQQMNNRVHYLNKIFEMSRYTLKSFEIIELKESLEKATLKIGVDLENIKLSSPHFDKIYHDNFKMISSMLIDLIEFLQFNGPGITAMQLSIIETKSPNVDILQMKVESGLNSRLKESLLNYSKFVDVIVKIIGGKFDLIEDSEKVTMELFLQLFQQNEKNEQLNES